MKILDEVGLSFDDVLLVPRYSEFSSRFNGEIDLSTEILPDLTLKYPIVSANMDTVTGWDMANTMNELGALGIIHRFQDYKSHSADIFQGTVSGPAIACIGTGESGLERLKAVFDTTTDGVLIDIAHGHCRAMIDQIKRVKELYPDLFIIAGNVATADGAYDLVSAGTHCIKIGVGNGALCSTRIHTGNGVPQLTAIKEVAQLKTEMQNKFTIISDGGIRNGGDVIKCLAMGADAVMVGSLFAGTSEAPGGVFSEEGGPTYKVYRGMASRSAQESWKGYSTSVEGEVQTVPFKGSVEGVFNQLIKRMLSGMSYQGARNLKELRENAVFIRQTSAGYRESLPHGKK